MNTHQSTRIKMKRVITSRLNHIYLNDQAQLGPLFIFIMGIVLIGFYYTILSPLMYDLTDVHQGMQDSGLYPIPSDKIEAMIMLQFAWKALPLICFIILFVWLIMKSLRENSGDV